MLTCFAGVAEKASAQGGDGEDKIVNNTMNGDVQDGADKCDPKEESMSYWINVVKSSH